MHNSTDHCHANHKVSLVMQIIRQTCSVVEHRNCDISQSCRLLQAVSPPVWANAKFTFSNAGETELILLNYIYTVPEKQSCLECWMDIKN
ncbi:hypothetical protein PoB_000677000 [Plakobranchus ocellatus]|uniref:Uncharacterized protein n=1 Tax=Plakobranchus ocellatus TaxID=259542 RepID=A0AAV3YBY3_9GAST|nr:hypothetical protein PoB_000677000 [Plakobranchus ocellatus]